MGRVKVEQRVVAVHRDQKLLGWCIVQEVREVIPKWVGPVGETIPMQHGRLCQSIQVSEGECPEGVEALVVRVPSVLDWAI